MTTQQFYAEPELDVPAVLKKLSAPSLKEVIQQCDAILAQLDAPIVPRRRRRNVALAISLHSFLCFLTVGKFHTHSAKWDAALYRPVVARLVHRNELKKTFLDQVDREIVAAPTQELLSPEQEAILTPPTTRGDESNSDHQPIASTHPMPSVG